MAASSTLDGLSRDLEKIAKRAPRDLEAATKFAAKAGNTYGKGLARERSRRHGRRYPAAWSAEHVANAKWEFGPEVDKPQGGMSFEGGSRNQPPHNELADTFDIVAPALQRGLDRRVERWFWNP